MFLIPIAYALVLAPVSYFGVRAVFTRYGSSFGKHGVIMMQSLQALLVFTPLLAALCQLESLFNVSAISATALIPLWSFHEFYTDFLAYCNARNQARIKIQILESIIEEDFDSIDVDGDDSLNEQDIVNASISFKDHDPEKAAALEQLLADIAEVGHVIGVIEQETYSDDTLVRTVRRNIYAVRRSDLRKYPATLRSKYRIW